MTDEEERRAENGANEEQSTIEALKAEMERLDQLREEDREKISFEWCESIRRAGDVYRETESLESVRDTLNEDETTAREAVALYLLVFESQPSEPREHGVDASSKASGTAIRFFRNHTDPEDFAAASDENGVEEYRNRICEFVGSLYRYRDPDDVELTAPPDPSTLRTPNELLVKQIGTFANSLSESIAESNRRITARAVRSVQSTFRQQVADAISITPQVSSMFNVSRLLDPIREHYNEVQSAIIEGVHNFEAPEDYDESKVIVNERAQNIAVRTVEDFLALIIEEKLTGLFPYLDQLHEGLEAYKDGEYTLPCYTFTFALEGIMEQLCREQGFELEENENYYSINTKRDAFAKAYSDLPRGYYGVETGEIIPQLENFLKHRNALAHGDPNAVIDENIATVAMLFVMLTLYPTVELLSDNGESET